MGKKIVYTADKDMSVSQAVLCAVPALTHAKADLLIKSGEVRLNGTRVKSNAPLVSGDVLAIFVPDSFLTAGIKTVYEDGEIVVFDKPKHVTFDSIPSICGLPLIAVHRLDTNTTGLILFAKTEDAAREIEQAFKTRRAKKRYEAVVYPPPQKNADSLTAYSIVKDGVAIVSDVPLPGYKTMLTDYTVVKKAGEAALLYVYPHTGRTHQIRAHLAHIGCPIVGDPKYGNGCKLSGAPDSQMLAATELSFEGLSGRLVHLNGKVFRAENGFDLSFLSDGKQK